MVHGGYDLDCVPVFERYGAVNGYEVSLVLGSPDSEITSRGLLAGASGACPRLVMFHFLVLRLVRVQGGGCFWSVLVRLP